MCVCVSVRVRECACARVLRELSVPREQTSLLINNISCFPPDLLGLRTLTTKQENSSHFYRKAHSVFQPRP